MRRARHHLIRIAVIAAVMSVTYASAASLNLAPVSLGAGGSVVTPCDPNGVNVSYTLSADNVTQITVFDIEPGCAGGELSVALADGSQASIGEAGPLTVSATSHTLTFAPQPISYDVMAVHIVIAGP